MSHVNCSCVRTLYLFFAIQKKCSCPVRISLGFKDNKKRKQQVNDWARKDKILKATVDKVGEEEIILRFMSGSFTLMIILS